MMINMDRKDGMQLGGPIDRCRECSKPLEYEECFAIAYNGNRICYCMDCFQKMLGKYMLIDPTAELDDIEVAEPPEEFKEEAKEEVKKEETKPTKKSTKK